MYDRGGRGRALHIEGVRVGLEKGQAARRANLVLVKLARPQIGNEDFPDARDAQTAHLVQASVPVVEIADDAHARRMRGPHGERDPAHSSIFAYVRAELFIDALVSSLVKEMLVERSQCRKIGIRVALRKDFAVAIIDPELVRKDFTLISYEQLEETSRVRLDHRTRALSSDDELALFGIGSIGAQHHALGPRMSTQNRVRVRMRKAEQAVQFVRGHGRITDLACNPLSARL